jgi:hypothetical protein
MGKTLKVSSKSGFGGITFKARKDRVDVIIDFQESFKTGLFSVKDKMILIEALNEMERVFIDYIGVIY